MYFINGTRHVLGVDTLVLLIKLKKKEDKFKIFDFV